MSNERKPGPYVYNIYDKDSEYVASVKMEFNNSSLSDLKKRTYKLYPGLMGRTDLHFYLYPFDLQQCKEIL